MNEHRVRGLRRLMAKFGLTQLEKLLRRWESSRKDGAGENFFACCLRHPPETVLPAGRIFYQFRRELIAVPGCLL